MDYLAENNINHIDYKDTETLRRFLDNQGRIRPRRHTKLSAKKQREAKEAIKRARYMALLPYIDS